MLAQYKCTIKPDLKIAYKPCNADGGTRVFPLQFIEAGDKIKRPVSWRMLTKIGKNGLAGQKYDGLVWKSALGFSICCALLFRRRRVVFGDFVTDCLLDGAVLVSLQAWAAFGIRFLPAASHRNAAFVRFACHSCGSDRTFRVFGSFRCGGSSVSARRFGGGNGVSRTPPRTPVRADKTFGGSGRSADLPCVFPLSRSKPALRRGAFRCPVTDALRILRRICLLRDGSADEISSSGCDTPRGNKSYVGTADISAVDTCFFRFACRVRHHRFFKHKER